MVVSAARVPRSMACHWTSPRHPYHVNWGSCCPALRRF